MAEIGKQLKKGVIEMLVLELLSRKDMYGYEIIQQLDRDSEGAFCLKEGTLYPVLYRLEDSGCIESYWEDGGSIRGVPRKYYRVTGNGVVQLGNNVEQWKALSKTVNKVLKGGGKDE